MAAPMLPGGGELNARIALVLWSDVPNASFGVDQTFGAPLERWAKAEAVHSLTIRAGLQTGETPTHLFTIRAGAGTNPEDITVNHVIEWKARRYRVLDAIGLGSPVQFTRISAKDLGVIA